MQVFISHIDCLVTTLLDWTENLFVHEQTCRRQDAEANRCGVTFQSTISAHKHKSLVVVVVFMEMTVWRSSALSEGWCRSSAGSFEGIFKEILGTTAFTLLNMKLQPAAS